jgi:hypothetical protein
MNHVTANRWGLLSLVLTLGTYFALLILGEVLHQRSLSYHGLDNAVRVVWMVSALAGFICGVVGVNKDRSKGYALVGLLLALVSPITMSV